MRKYLKILAELAIICVNLLNNISHLIYLVLGMSIVHMSLSVHMASNCSSHTVINTLLPLSCCGDCPI